MTGYQGGRGRGGERPSRYRGAPEGPGTSRSRRLRGQGYPDRGHRDGGHRRGYRDAGYRDAGYRDAGYREARYRGADYGEPDYRGAGYREADYGGAGYGEAGYGEAGYGEADYREADYREADYGGTGYGGAGYREADYGEAGYGEAGYRGSAGYGDGYREDRHRGRTRVAAGRDGDGRGDPDGGRAHGNRRRDTTGGAEGNERLTALTGTLLLGLLAAEGFTILSIHQLLTLHFFIGMLLVGPVLLKAGSTVYRFIRYYTGAPDYRRKGPPAPLLRLLGPFVLLLSAAVIGSGIMLAITGPSGQLWIFVHKASFVLWFGAMSIHVLAYVWRLPQLVSGEMAVRAGARARDVLAGRPARWLLLTASLLLGLVLALMTYHQAAAWAGFAGGG
jgi:hypothetical protein